VSSNDFTQSHLSGLDESAYRDYSRSRLARARIDEQSKQNKTWRGPVDLLITFFLFSIVLMVVLHERGII
jgi:hypothetical protein